MDKHISMREIQDAYLSALASIRNEIDGIFMRQKHPNTKVTGTLKNLFAYLSSRSQAVLFLVSHGYGWDAEIILRSYYETAVRIVFICTASDDDKDGLVDEFWDRSASDRKSARKASIAERLFSEGDLSKDILQKIQDEKLFDLSNRQTKNERKRIEQKWSFSEIVEELERRAARGAPLAGVKSVLHTYGMASHLIHADASAMDLMIDRMVRPEEERQLLEAAHFIRIMSDLSYMSFLCTDNLRSHYNDEAANMKGTLEMIRAVDTICEPLIIDFENSQRDFYAEYKSE